MGLFGRNSKTKQQKYKMMINVKKEKNKNNNNGERRKMDDIFKHKNNRFTRMFVFLFTFFV